MCGPGPGHTDIEKVGQEDVPNKKDVPMNSEGARVVFTYEVKILMLG